MEGDYLVDKCYPRCMVCLGERTWPPPTSKSAAFTDENAAREAMEAFCGHNGPVCPHCGCAGKIGKVEGKSARPGLYYCGDCKKQFTVTVGTIFERSKVPLSKWWYRHPPYSPRARRASVLERPPIIPYHIHRL